MNAHATTELSICIPERDVVRLLALLNSIANPLTHYDPDMAKMQTEALGIMREQAREGLAILKALPSLRDKFP